MAQKNARRLASLAAGLATLVSVSAQGADVGVAGTPSSEAAPARSRIGGCATRFDYLVLASIADSPMPLSLSLYRSPAEWPISGAAPCQGGGLEGSTARSAERRSSQIT